MLKKSRKDEMIKEIEGALSKSKSLVFVNFHGLNVATTSEMRRALRSASVDYLVAKKSLIKRALGEITVEGDAPDMPGELALAWGEDLVAPAREIYAFQKKNPDNVKIVGGIFEGRFINKLKSTQA